MTYFKNNSIIKEMEERKLNKNTPSELLAKLSDDKDVFVSKTAEEALKNRKEKSKANIER